MSDIPALNRKPPAFPHRAKLVLVASNGQRLASPERDKLIVDHQKLVHAIAVEIAGTVHGHIEFDDLIDAGMQGLVRAADRYDATQNGSFANYAKYRIRGEIVDARNDFFERSSTTPLALMPVGKEPKTRINIRQMEIRQALGRLTRKEQRVLMLYYENGCTMQEIGKKLGVKKSRVSQIHIAAIAQLRTILK